MWFTSFINSINNSLILCHLAKCQYFQVPQEACLYHSNNRKSNQMKMMGATCSFLVQRKNRFLGKTATIQFVSFDLDNQEVTGTIMIIKRVHRKAIFSIIKISRNARYQDGLIAAHVLTQVLLALTLENCIVYYSSNCWNNSKRYLFWSSIWA